MKILVITEKSLIFVMFPENSTYFTNEFDLFWFPSLRLDLQGAAQITQSFSSCLNALWQLTNAEITILDH